MPLFIAAAITFSATSRSIIEQAVIPRTAGRRGTGSCWASAGIATLRKWIVAQNTYAYDYLGLGPLPVHIFTRSMYRLHDDTDINSFMRIMHALWPAANTR